MQSYSTIIGVVELRSQGVSYTTTQKRYGVGSSTVTLIIKRCRELGLTTVPTLPCTLVSFPFLSVRPKFVRS